MLCISRGPSQFCEMSAKVTNWVTDPFKDRKQLSDFTCHMHTRDPSISKRDFISKFNGKVS